MSEQTAQEPTMEEILASIRRIISEDDAPAGDAPADAAAAEEAPEAAAPEPEFEAEPEAAFDPPPEPEPVAEAEEEVLELTERVDSVGDIDVFEAPPEPPEASFEPEPAPPAPLADVGPEENLVSHAAASVAASAFGQLSAAVAMPRDGQTLDGVVRELLRPLLKEWLDAHLPSIVQSAVAEEVERIARTGR